jgi:hypothetical protein
MSAAATTANTAIATIMNTGFAQFGVFTPKTLFHTGLIAVMTPAINAASNGGHGCSAAA